MSTQNAKSSWIRLKNGKILWMLKNYCYRLRINNCIINYWKTLQIDAHIIKHLLTMSKIRGWRLLRRSLYKHGLIGWCIMETQQQIGTLIIWHCFFFLHFILLHNRVEGTHARLKKLFHDCMGNLCSCWDTMNNILVFQRTMIKASFQKSINMIDHIFNSRYIRSYVGLY